MNEQSHNNQTPETDEDEINLLELLRVIVRRKKLIIAMCSTAIVLSVCYSLTLKNVYSATAKCFPPQRESPLSSFASIVSQSNPIQALGGMGGTSDLYLAIIKSRTVTDAVVKRLDLQKQGTKTISFDAARRAATGAVKCAVGKDGILTVTARNKDPQRAALLANTFVDEMIRRSVALYLTKAGTERHFLESRMDKVREELKNAESELKVFQEQHKTLKADAQATVAIDGIARLRAEIVSKEVQLATLRNSMTEESSDVKALQAGISRLKSQLGAMTGSGGSDNIIPATGNLPGIGMEYVRRLREVKVQEAIFEQLSKQYEMAKINENKDSSSVQIIDEAIPPVKKSGPKRSLIVIISTFIAFIGSLGIIFIQEYFSKLPPEDAEIWRDIKQSLRFRRQRDV
jgi:uncharacterized protein involved in exopolysaccharide biosynthesis